MKKSVIGFLLGAGVVVAVLVVLAAAGAYKSKFTQPDIRKACTEEAKICPDGSAVGRSGPKCEFAPCPAEALCEGGPCPAASCAGNACPLTQAVQPAPVASTTPAATGTQMANPASVNCGKVGGTLVIQKNSYGDEYGLCYFEDNRACEEWALLRGDCPKGGVKTTGFDSIDQSYCAWSGGQTLAVPNSVCTFKNGSKCATIDYYNGKCQPK